MSKQEPMRVWLVQRGSFRLKPDELSQVFGLDSLVSYHYMGAAEFEFGGLGKSLRRIVSTRSAYSVWLTKHEAHDKRKLVAFSREDQRVDVQDVIDRMVENKLRPKEATHMREAVAGDTRFRCSTSFWWDIENDWLCWLGDQHNPLVARALEAVAQKWAAKESRS